MDRVHVIRHKVLVEGLSRRRVAQEMGISRNTVKKYVTVQTVPKRKATEPRGRPVLERVRPRLEELIEEWADRQTPKQRVTAKRLHQQLRSEGVDVGYTTVSTFMAERKRKKLEVFVPLVFQPGEVAQVDFFEVMVDIQGKRRKAYKFLMRMMHSGRDFAWLYDHADQIAFLDGHVRAFEHFGAVPHRLVYDNLSAAVRKVTFPKRQMTARFTALACHYIFEPCFARPGEGHDKGGVESRGKGIRLRHLTPIPRGESLQQLSQALMEALDAEARDKMRHGGQTVLTLFEQERASMLPLAEPFDPRKTELCTVSRLAKVQVGGASYSVPSHWKLLEITAMIGCEEVTLINGDESEVYRRGAFGEGQTRYRHYLPELAQKPQALRQVVHQLLPELDDVYGQLWRLLVDVHGPLGAARLFAGVLQAVVDRGEGAVSTAVAHALRNDRMDLLGLAPETAPALVEVPTCLAEHQVESARASDYDVLMTEVQS